MGVSLDWRCLRVLVLTDKAAIEAMLRVCKYLKDNDKPNSPLFSLRNPEATFNAAVEFGANDPAVQAILQQETLDADTRIDQHWKEVLAKQAEVERLNALIVDAQSDITRITYELLLMPDSEKFDTETKYRGTYPHHTSYEEKSNSALHTLKLDAISARETQIRAHKAAVTETEKVPTPVIQPLPEDDKAALKILFFMFMPEHLRALARFSFMAQQALLPRSFTQSTGMHIMRHE
jgi:hypothetical protein